jgi:hypothetical protein
MFHVNVRCECCKDGDYTFEGQSERGRICVSCGRCKQVDLTIVYGFNGPDNYIMVVVEFFSNGSKI